MRIKFTVQLHELFLMWILFQAPHVGRVCKTPYAFYQCVLIHTYTYTQQMRSNLMYSKYASSFIQELHHLVCTPEENRIKEAKKSVFFFNANTAFVLTCWFSTCCWCCVCRGVNALLNIFRLLISMLQSIMYWESIYVCLAAYKNML